MDIFDSDGKALRLTDNEFLAEGGEGRLYALHDRVFKIYLDAAKVIAQAKLDELLRLDRPNIVRPLGAIFNERGERIGFAMRRVPQDAVPLPRLFTSSYWAANAITPVTVTRIADEMRSTIAYIHSQGFLQVDGNEFNYMVSGDLRTPFFIDVDSYQTPGYPATAIMPSIRDYTRATFSQESDWFSFGIVAFQLFTGIHPFKGRHPDFANNEFEARIKAGISVFHPEVSYPSTVRDFSTIPANYRSWFEAMFVQGERAAAPEKAGIAVTRRPQHKIRDGAMLAIRQIASYRAAVRRFATINGQRVVQAGGELFVGTHAYRLPEQGSAYLLTEKGTLLFARITQGILELIDANSGATIATAMAAQRLWSTNNILYTLDGEKLTEVKLLSLAGHVVAAPGASRKVLPLTLQFFDGMALENGLGRPFVLLAVAPGIMPIIAMPELSGYHIVDARYERGVAALVIADASGSYHIARARFDKTFARYDLEIRDDIEALNFAVLERGIIVTVSRDGEIEIASANPWDDTVRVVHDAQIRSDMRLGNDAGALAFSLEEGIYTASLKS